MFNDHLSYYTTVKDKPTIFFVNLENPEQLANKYGKVLQIDFSYQGNDLGLPPKNNDAELIGRESKVITELTTFLPAFFAGYHCSENKVRMYFYCEDEKPLLTALKALDFIESATVQDDPKWEIYFDFLFASSLELQLNMTHHILETMKLKGHDLSHVYHIEHIFHFINHEEKMHEFMEEISNGEYFVSLLQYSAQAFSMNDDNAHFLVKAEQNIALDTKEIYQYIEKFDNLATKYGIKYVGWGFATPLEERIWLN